MDDERCSVGCTSTLDALTRRVESDVGLDSWAMRLDEAAAMAVPEAARGFFAGDWLGHALHPALTDVPIGFWPSAFVLDLIGGRGARPTAQRFVGFGVLSAVPTVLSGLTEFRLLDRMESRRVGLVHAGGNALATYAYLRSWQSRRRGHHGTGVAFGMFGSALATGAAYLGGHLAFGSPDSDENASG